MAIYRVYYDGHIDIEADSALEAECEAAFECTPDMCQAMERNTDKEEQL